MSLARNTASLAALALVAGALVATGGVSAASAADAVAGGQSSGDSLFPNQGNSGYDALHYDIKFGVDVTIATTSNVASTTNLPDATATITAKTTGAPLSSYSFDFQGTSTTLAESTLNVDSVTVNGAPATFTRIENTTIPNATTDKHKLVVTPSTPVDGEFVTVVKYSGMPVVHRDTDNSIEGWNNTVDGATFVNQPVGSMTLFPNNNTPSDTATYKFTITAPTMLRTSNFASAGGKPYQAGVVSNGELTSRTPSDDGTRTTWVWEQRKPMASELSTVSVGRYDIYTSDITLASGRTIPEWTFIDPAISVANQTTTLATRAQLKAMIDFYESKYGPYPGNSTGLITDNTTGINYALETQDRPFFPNSADRATTSHEIMHQWWGDGVAPTDWNDIWLNEGPATYAEAQFPYEGSGSSTTTTEQSRYAAWNSSSATGSVWTVPTAGMTQASQLFGSQVYNRGSWTLEALRTAIGADNYETLMRQYQTTYSGTQISGRRTAAFIAMAEQVSGRDLKAFFQPWLYGTTKAPWPVKFTFGVSGPTGQVTVGDVVTYTLTARNTGKVAMPAGGTVISVDVSDILDDASLSSTPAGVAADGNTLTWTVPATALGATSSVQVSFVVVDSSGTLKAVASATTLGGTAAAGTASTDIGVSPLSPAPVPTISGGTPTVGSPLTADTTGWAAGASLAYQWYIDGTPVTGATNATFTPGLPVVGFPVTVKVTGTQAGFTSVSQTSAATAVGVRGVLTAPTPTISGSPKIGVQLSADTSGWTPGTVFTYSWRANGTAISGASGPRYTPAVAAQAGQTIDVVVTGTNAGYTTVAKTSVATAPVVAGDPLSQTPVPIFTVQPKVGVANVPDYGSWDDGVAVTYQWAANGTNITGATTGSFTPTATQLGATLTVTATGTKPGIPAVSKTSNSSSAVEAGTQVLQPTPTITGTPRVDTAASGVPGTWDTGSTRTYKWYADGVEIAGATAISYTPSLDQVGKVLTFEVTSVRAGYTTVTKTSAGKTIVGYAQTLAPTPTISGDAQYPKTLTVDPGTWDADTTLTRQWFAGGEAIEGATALDYTLRVADIGKVITVSVTSTKPTYETVTKTSDATSAVATGDLVLTPTPTISGTAKVNVELTAVAGTWDEGVTLGYQWFADDEAIEGATASTYTVGSGKVGDVITVAVTGAKVGYKPTTTTSEPTAAVVLGDLAATPTPTISGTPKVDLELTVVPGTWTEGTSLSYQWLADDEELDGETGSTLTPEADLVGAVITVAVTGTKSGYTTVTKTSAATAGVAEGDFVSAPVPTITGTPKVAVELTALTGDWDAGTELSFQWFVDGTAVEGATDETFTPSAEDAGSVITVEVTGTKSGYAPVTKASAETTAVADGDLVDTPVPTIEGRVKVAVELTAVAGDWDAGTELSFQWFVDGEAVDGATDETFTPSGADAGSVITVEVTGTKAGYASVTTTSAASVEVAEGDLVATPVPTLSGDVKVGSLVTAVIGEWDADTDLAYEWHVSGELVSTGLTYTPVAADLGQTIFFQVAASKPGYTTVYKAVEPTVIAAGDLASTPTPVIRGTVRVGNSITVSPGTWDLGTTLKYQWKRNGVAISGATAATYQVRSADHTRTITVTVTGTKAGYTTTSTTSGGVKAAAGVQSLQPKPVITGTEKVGKTLKVKAASYDTGVTRSYTWFANGVKFGANKNSVKLSSQQKGKRITVRVTATKAGYASVAKTSSSTATIK